MELRLAFIGFGNVARAFAQMLDERKYDLTRLYDITFRATAIATARHGCVLSDRLNLLDAAECVSAQGKLSNLENCSTATDSLSVIDNCDADILFETTTLDPTSGEPASGFIRRAIGRRVNVVTANKGPVAFAYRELKAMAEAQRVAFRFEGAVMDGAPVFNLVESCLMGARVTGFDGVLNSTTNLILTGMEEGRGFEECLIEAQQKGIAEANADYDLDGWDAAVKAVCLANVLMGEDIRPADLRPRGIRHLTSGDLKDALARGKTIKLIARTEESADGLELRVGPEETSLGTPLALARGTSNILQIRTDLMGEIGVIETDPGVRQTAYALLSDMLRVAIDLPKR